MIAENKNCLYCSKPVRGRADKKFCDDACRNAYHNQLHEGEDPAVRIVNSFLRRNHHILKKLMGLSRKRGRCSKKTLLLSGFNFHYFTHRYVNNDSHECCCCYEFEYRVGNETVYIARKSKAGLQKANT